MSSFALDLSRFAKKADDRMHLVIRKIAIEIFSRVVAKTPVKTGRARGNWQVGLGEIPSGVLDSTSDPTDQIAAAVAQAQPGQTIYMVNNLPYIPVLEHGDYPEGPKTVGGFSVQAPQGMVRVTLVEYPHIVETSAQEAKSERP